MPQPSWFGLVVGNPLRDMPQGGPMGVVVSYEKGAHVLGLLPVLCM